MYFQICWINYSLKTTAASLLCYKCWYPKQQFNTNKMFSKYSCSNTVFDKHETPFRNDIRKNIAKYFFKEIFLCAFILVRSLTEITGVEANHGYGACSVYAEAQNYLFKQQVYFLKNCTHKICFTYSLLCKKNYGCFVIFKNIV